MRLSAYAAISLITPITSKHVHFSGISRGLSEEIKVSNTSQMSLYTNGENIDEFNNTSASHGIRKKNKFMEMPFDSWIEDYIRFHNSAIINGKLKEGVRYVVYSCSNKKNCGGIGDRVLSMVKAFYFAIATGRVLLIDSTFPTPLSNYLNPNFVQWDATYPKTKKMFDDMNTVQTILPRKSVDGYMLGRCNGSRSHKLITVLQSKNIEALLQPHGGEISVSRGFYQAFWALFHFDKAVLKRADIMKMNAGLILPQSNGAMVPFVGLHIRHGDSAMVTSKGGRKRVTKVNEVVQCYHNFQRHFPGKYPVGYIASDSNEEKRLIHKKEKTIHFPKDMSIFHLDLSTRYKSGADMSDNAIHEGVLDVYAELAVLGESNCLITSKSMFSFLVYYIRDEAACSVYLKDCNDNTVRRKVNIYHSDPYDIIYKYWFSKKKLRKLRKKYKEMIKQKTKKKIS